MDGMQDGNQRLGTTRELCQSPQASRFVNHIFFLDRVVSILRSQSIWQDTFLKVLPYLVLKTNINKFKRNPSDQSRTGDQPVSGTVTAGCDTNYTTEGYFSVLQYPT